MTARLQVLFITVSIIFLGCSAEKKNVFSTTYHNTTAHYNAFFIAREHIREIETAVFESHQDNYNQILSVLPDIDTTFTRSLDDELEDVIKKSSLAIQLHKNSKWVDDSYVLIGKARMYQGDFVNAIETFKYVNTKGEDDVARQRALNSLMRTFIEYDEFNNAIAVADFLKKEKMDDENLHDFYLTNAYLYQLTEDYQNMIAYLNEAIKLSKKSDHLARKYFIAGQVYHKFGYDSAAYSNYHNCIKSNPPYELSFYAKLYMAQVTQLAKSNNVKKIRKYFRKLEKDKKNEEYRDKIYYELAKFEQKQGNFDQAVESLKKSVAASTMNQRQKAYSYLMLGELQYDHYRNYLLAKNYYDSVMTVLPSDDGRYEAISTRQQVLTEFVENYNTIHEQDSLLGLAAMSKSGLDAFLDEVIAQKKLEKEELAKQQKKEQRRSSSTYMDEDTPFASLTNSSSEGGQWYFYNSNAISTGRNEFLRRWGNRQLEDNWRRSQKAGSRSVEADELIVQEEIPVIDSVDMQKQEEEFSAESEKTALLSTIPFTAEEKQIALSKVEEAHYNLGNIYNFKLQEKDNAAETFEALITRFPESEHVPEALYQLYLLYMQKNNPRADYCKSELLSKYPDTDFAKLIENPNYYADRDAASERLEKLYDIAFDYYDNGNYDEAGMLVSRALRQYPDNPFSDHLKLLDIMVKAKVEGIHKYQYELQGFIDNNPDSNLKDYAEKLLTSSKELQEDEVRKRGISYIGDLDLEHFYIISYENRGTIAEDLSEAIDNFIQNEYSDKNLNIGNLVLEDGIGLVLVNQFNSKADAEKFLRKIHGNHSPLEKFGHVRYEDYIITKENFEILFKTKGLKEYKKFYQEYYKI